MQHLILHLAAQAGGAGIAGRIQTAYDTLKGLGRPVGLIAICCAGLAYMATGWLGSVTGGAIALRAMMCVGIGLLCVLGAASIIAFIATMVGG